MIADPWQPFASFEVNADHVPNTGYRLVLRLVPDPTAVLRTVGMRARSSEPADPVVGQSLLRAGMAVAQSSHAAFVYANTAEVIVVVDASSVTDVGESAEVHDRLVSKMAARLARILGVEIPVTGRMYEFPNTDIVRRALATIIDAAEEQTPKRTAALVGAQMVGRGEGFHPSLIETIEEQTSLLQENGIDLEALPNWWWRGIAARTTGDELEFFDELGDGVALGALIAE
jgi:hypothetical protein